MTDVPTDGGSSAGLGGAVVVGGGPALVAACVRLQVAGADVIAVPIAALYPRPEADIAALAAAGVVVADGAAPLASVATGRRIMVLAGKTYA